MLYYIIFIILLYFHFQLDLDFPPKTFSPRKGAWLFSKIF